MFLAFGNDIFHLFSKFLSEKVEIVFWEKEAKLKLFSGKVRQSAKNSLNQNLFIRSLLENTFEATFRLETNVLSVFK